MSNGALEALEHIEFCYRSELVMDSAIQKDIETIRKQLKRAEELEQCIADAAICLLKPNDGICDTIWMGKSCTLYEHLVSQLDVELTGDIDRDIETLTQIRNKP